MAVIQFTCSCGNTDPVKTIEYDGALGYEAIVCTICGAYHDHTGEHPVDDFSRRLLDLKGELS
jgi:transcription elongation factor Elf1